jgi:hypothetical protein
MRSTTPLSRIAVSTYSISGRPASGRMFLSGMDFEPSRAGTSASVEGVVTA